MATLFDELLGIGDAMKSQAAEVVAPKRAKVVKAKAKQMAAGGAVVFSKPTTAAKRKAAADRLLRSMPAAVKKGEKPAHQVLAEYRKGV